MPESPARLLTRSAGRLAGAVLDLIWPPSCPSCGAGMEPGAARLFCVNCSAQLPLVTGRACRRCAMPLGPFEEDHRGRYCIDCGGKNLVFKRAATAGLYEGPLAEVIKAYKYTPRSRCAHLAGYLSRLLIPRLLGEDCELEAAEADLVVPVPMHRGRRRRRGFDSTAELARLVARGLRLPVIPGLLLKTRPTRPQMGLSRPARLQNVGGCFTVSRPADVKGKLVLLIDDVITTCATAEECARTLRIAGAREVRVAAVARAIEGRQTPPPAPE